MRRRRPRIVEPVVEAVREIDIGQACCECSDSGCTCDVAIDWPLTDDEETRLDMWRRSVKIVRGLA